MDQKHVNSVFLIIEDSIKRIIIHEFHLILKVHIVFPPAAPQRRTNGFFGEAYITLIIQQGFTNYLFHKLQQDNMGYSGMCETVDSVLEKKPSNEKENVSIKL